MNNAGAEFSSDGGELAEMMQQRVYQCAAVAGVIGCARAGVDHHARGLVDDRDIVVFVNYFQRNFFRYRAQRAGLRLTENGDAFAAPQTHGRLGFQIIYQDLLFRNQLLNSCAADVWEMETRNWSRRLPPASAGAVIAKSFCLGMEACVERHRSIPQSGGLACYLPLGPQRLSGNLDWDALWHAAAQIPDE